MCFLGFNFLDLSQHFLHNAVGFGDSTVMHRFKAFLVCLLSFLLIFWI